MRLTLIVNEKFVRKKRHCSIDCSDRINFKYIYSFHLCQIEKSFIHIWIQTPQRWVIGQLYSFSFKFIDHIHWWKKTSEFPFNFQTQRMKWNLIPTNETVLSAPCGFGVRAVWDLAVWIPHVELFIECSNWNSNIHP